MPVSCIFGQHYTITHSKKNCKVYIKINSTSPYEKQKCHTTKELQILGKGGVDQQH